MIKRWFKTTLKNKSHNIQLFINAFYMMIAIGLLSWVLIGVSYFLLTKADSLWKVLTSKMMILVGCGAGLFAGIFFGGFFKIKNHFKKASRHYANSNWLTKSEWQKKTIKNIFNKQQNTAGWVVSVRKYHHHLQFTSVKLCHGLVVGSTGSGKTQKIVLPNIIFNVQSQTGPSMVVTDPKGAILKLMRHYLQRYGYQIVVLDFVNFAGAKWNPLVSIQKQWTAGKYDKAEQELILYVDVVFPTPATTSDPFWHQAAKKLIRGVIMGLIIEHSVNNITPKPILPRQIHEKIAQPRLVLVEWLAILVKSNARLKLCLGALIYENEKTLSSIINQADSELSRLSFGLFNEMCTGNEIDFMQLRKKPTVIFIKTSTTQSSFHFLAQLFIENLNNFLLTPSQLQHPRPLLLILDEFGNIPRIKSFSEVIANAREYNFWYLIIIQYCDQLNRYSDQAGIAANTDLKYYLGTSDIKTTKAISAEYGQQLINHRQSKSNKVPTNFMTKEWLIDNYGLTKLTSEQMIVKLKATDPYLVTSEPFWEIKKYLKMDSS